MKMKMPANTMKSKKRRRCWRRSGALRLSPAGELLDKGVSDEDMDPFGRGQSLAGDPSQACARLPLAVDAASLADRTVIAHGFPDDFGQAVRKVLVIEQFAGTSAGARACRRCELTGEDRQIEQRCRQTEYHNQGHPLFRHCGLPTNCPVPTGAKRGKYGKDDGAKRW
jgi:hypothetical protein